MRPIEPINRLIQTQSKLLQHTIHTKKKKRSASVTKFSQQRASISLKRASATPQSKLCCVIPFFFYTNNIQKYYSVSRCVISIIIVIAPTSYNDLLQGSLPEFLPNGSLRSLLLSGTNFSGALPDTIGNLRRLSKIDLSMCNFNG